MHTYDSLFRIVPYIIILIAACATPKERGWDKPAGVILCAVNVVATLPWVVAEMTRSNSKWPEIVSTLVTILCLIAAILLLYRRKKQAGAEKDKDQAQ